MNLFGRHKKRKGHWVMWVPEKKKPGFFSRFKGRTKAKGRRWQARHKHQLRRSLRSGKTRFSQWRAWRRGNKEYNRQDKANKSFDDWIAKSEKKKEVKA